MFHGISTSPREEYMTLEIKILTFHYFLIWSPLLKWPKKKIYSLFLGLAHTFALNGTLVVYQGKIYKHKFICKFIKNFILSAVGLLRILRCKLGAPLVHIKKEYDCTLISFCHLSLICNGLMAVPLSCSR